MKTVANKQERLDVLLAENFEFSRSHAKNMIEQQLVSVDGKVANKAGEVVKTGQVVEFVEAEATMPNIKPQDIDFDIVYEDDDLLVIDKPQGLVVHPCSTTKDGTLVNGLMQRVHNLSGINGVLRPGIVHRLDKNTSGLMLVAKNDASHISLAKQIKDKTCKRKYIALLLGNLRDDFGHIETFLGRDKKDRKRYAVSVSGKLAISDYKVLQRYLKYCLVEFELKTGRTHQIRVHCKYLGCPVVGDEVYGKAEKGLRGQLLHSHYIEFVHPRTQKLMQFEAKIPKYFSDFLVKIDKTKVGE